MGNVTHIGVHTGDNQTITPTQLLDLARADIESQERAPTSMIIYMIEKDGTDDTVYTYRSNLTIDKEQCLMSNQLFKLQWRRVIA
jgi:hypothetical protein